MHTVLRKLLFELCLVYIDDILVFSENMEEHIEHLDEIFKRFRAAILKLPPAKCSFGAPQVTYLGHILSKKDVQSDPSKIEAMRTFPQPTSPRTLKSFLGSIGFHRRYIRVYSEIVSPMLRLLKKDEKFAWDEQCQESFENLKNAMVNAPILRFPDL